MGSPFWTSMLIAGAIGTMAWRNFRPQLAGADWIGVNFLAE